jgi:protein CpxP
MKRITQNKFLVLLVAILLLANLGLLLYFFAFKKDGHHGPEGKGQRPVAEFMQKELGFSDAQAAKFQQLRDRHKEAIKPLIQNMQQLKDSLYSLLRDPSTPDSLVNSLAGRIGEKQKEWESMIFQHFKEVRAICDSSQLPKFDSLVHRMINKGAWMKKGDSTRKPDRH